MKNFILLLAILLSSLVQAQVTQFPQVYYYGAEPGNPELIIHSSNSSSSSAITELSITAKIGADALFTNSGDPYEMNWVRVSLPSTSSTNNFPNYGYLRCNEFYGKINSTNNYATVNTTSTPLGVRTCAGCTSSFVTSGGQSIWYGKNSILALTGSTSSGWYEIYLPNGTGGYPMAFSQPTGWVNGQYLSFPSSQSYKIIGGRVCNGSNNCSFGGNVNQATITYSGLGTTKSGNGSYEYKVPINWNGTLTCSHPDYNTSTPISYNISSSGHDYSKHFILTNASSCINPGEPTNVSGSVYNQTSADLSWRAGSPAGSSPITYYWVVGTSRNVNYNGTGVVKQGTTSNTSVSVSNLSPGTTYYLRVFSCTNCGGGYCSDYSTSSAFTTSGSSCTPVSISTQPQSQSKNVGQTATFSVSASGTAPFTYQWRKNGSNISGATGSSYTTPVLTQSNNGDVYSCYITNCNGTNSVASNSAPLSITNASPSVLVIQNVIKNNSAFKTPKQLWSGTTTQSLTPIKICADGSNATEFIFTNNTGINSSDIRFLVRSDPGGEISDKTGYFIRNAENLSIQGNIITTKYTHPLYLESQFKPSKLDYIDIVDVNNPNSYIFSIPIQIYRAPVIMVHGFRGGGKGESFYTTKDFLLNNQKMYSNESNIFPIYVVDYHDNSYKSLDANSSVVPLAIDDILFEARRNYFSSGKVDLIGFSMGGLLSRIYLQSSGYLQKQNINKLITINTPHFGSQWGNLFTNILTIPVVTPILVATIKLDLGLNANINENFGAVKDLAVGSSSITKLNQHPSLNRSTVPTHVIGTTLDFSYPTDNIFAKVINAVAIASLKPFSSYIDWLFFNAPNDRVVSLNSQLGGLSSMHSSRGSEQFHIGANANQYVMSELSWALSTSPNNPNYYTNEGFIPKEEKSNYRLERQDEIVENIHKKMYEPKRKIRILNPNSNDILLPESKLNVNIEADKYINRIFLTSYSKMGDDLFLDTLLSNSEGNYEYVIPSNAKGNIKIVALGYDEEGFVDYDTVTIQVKQTATLDSLVAVNSPIYLQELNTGSVTVEAYFNDGSSYWIDNTDGVDYILADTSVATFLFGNLIYGKKIGETSVTVNFQNKSLSIPVYVTDRDTTISPFDLCSIIPIPEINVSGSTQICEGESLTLTASDGDIYLWSTGETSKSVVVHQAGEYFVNVSIDSCSKTSDTITITVINPVKTTESIDICDGETYTLRDGTLVNESGTYLVSIQNESQCDSIFTTYLNVLPLPEKPIITELGGVLFSNYMNGNQWYYNNQHIENANESYIMIDKSGKYSVEHTDEKGCKSVSNIYEVVITSIEKLASVERFTIYPNPNDGYFSVEIIATKVKTAKMDIVNVLGQVISSEELKNLYGKQTFKKDLSQYGKGLYFVNLYFEEGVVTRRVVVE